MENGPSPCSRLGGRSSLRAPAHQSEPSRNSWWAGAAKRRWSHPTVFAGSKEHWPCDGGLAILPVRLEGRKPDGQGAHPPRPFIAAARLINGQGVCPWHQGWSVCAQTGRGSVVATGRFRPSKSSFSDGNVSRPIDSQQRRAAVASSKLLNNMAAAKDFSRVLSGFGAVGADMTGQASQFRVLHGRKRHTARSLRKPPGLTAIGESPRPPSSPLPRFEMECRDESVHP
jgi:hypothetical protein